MNPNPTLEHYYVRVWETEKAHKAWTNSQDCFFCDKDGAERFCKGLRSKERGAFTYELGSFSEDDYPTTEPFSFWNRKEGFSQ